MPFAIDAIAPANTATTTAPATPTKMPVLTSTPRPRRPRAAASTSVTTRAASRTSRRTMSAVANILFGDDLSLGGLGVVLAEEAIGTGLQGTEDDVDRLTFGNNLL